MRTGVNALTAVFVVGVLAGLALTPDGRAWLRHPTVMLGDRAAASAPPSPAPAAAAPVVAPAVAAVTPLPARLAQGPLRIGVFGDSMADGLYAGLYRDLQGTPNVSVSKFSQVSTGLSRYDYVDIHAKTRAQLDEQPVDVAVLLFGTNDAQGIDTGGAVHPFGTDGWKAAYAARIDDLVALLRSRDVAVYWVGLPRMKRDSFDARMMLINGVVEARMQALGVPWIETTALTSNDAGGYEAYLPNEAGRRVLMRANDGIHMSMAGYLRLSAPVAARLKRDAGLDRPTAPAALPAAAPAA
ncbi:MAG: SGNH/GDSL hydrolase family protein [Brevundimonas sp.]